MEILNIYLQKTGYDKVLCNKIFKIAKNPKYDGYQYELASMANSFFYKHSAATHRGTGINSDVVSEN